MDVYGWRVMTLTLLEPWRLSRCAGRGADEVGLKRGGNTQRQCTAIHYPLCHRRDGQLCIAVIGYRLGALLSCATLNPFATAAVADGIQ